MIHRPSRPGVALEYFWRPVLQVHLALVALLLCSGKDPLHPHGWYVAASKIEDKEGLGGFGPSNNYSHPCGAVSPGEPGKISLIADPEKTVPLGKYRGLPLYLVNRTGEQVPFKACDSHLYIIQEALDRDGVWKALERFPTSAYYCGNSYHRVFLGPDYYWEFVALHQSGPFRTRLRFRLEAEGEAAQAKVGTALYSNEYEGDINPAHFIE